MSFHQTLVQQKKQPRAGSAAPDDSERHSQPDLDVYGAGDEDAFTPQQMEEFRRLANSRASNRPFSRQAGIVTDLPRPPTTMSIRAPSRAAMGGADTPHMFPGMKERPLTSASRHQDSRAGSAVSNRQGVATGAALYGGRDVDYDGAMDPTADYSASRRLRMNPRAFSKLSAGHSSRIKIRVMHKEGQFVMKPVSGRPGVVSVSTGQDKDDGEPHQVMDSKDKMAVVKLHTSFKSPTLSSDLKVNNLVAIQKSLLGHDTKRMTVNEVMAKSRDRRARLFRVQAASGRLDDWEIPGENRRPPTRATSAGGRSFERGPSRLERGPSRLERGPSRLALGVTEERNRTPSPNPGAAKPVIDVTIQKRDDTPDGARRPQGGQLDRTKSAPAYRHRQARSSTPITLPTAAPPPSPVPTPQPSRGGLAVPKSAVSRSPSPNRRGPRHPQLSVIQLELEEQAQSQTNPHHSPRPTGTQPKSASLSSNRPPSSPTRAVFPVSAKSLTNETSKARPVSVRFGKDKKRSSAEETAYMECSVHIRHIHTLRDSAAVVRRWKEFDLDREEKLNRWRMRMSFAATRRGNLGKVLSRV
ncbi:hypothetical protein BaRGS_00001712 [Batillaria attramentaria]|uniref:Uncharacterized protein n=1 Tax=Batillaria attramentaria TaxID=370345 RepID=A0ABD0M537_9CAEN